MKSSGQLKQVIWLVGTYVYQQVDYFVRQDINGNGSRQKIG